MLSVCTNTCASTYIQYSSPGRLCGSNALPPGPRPCPPRGQACILHPFTVPAGPDWSWRRGPLFRLALGVPCPLAWRALGLGVGLWFAGKVFLYFRSPSQQKATRAKRHSMNALNGAPPIFTQDRTEYPPLLISMLIASPPAVRRNSAGSTVTGSSGFGSPSRLVQAAMREIRHAPLSLNIFLDGCILFVSTYITVRGHHSSTYKYIITHTYMLWHGMDVERVGPLLLISWMLWTCRQASEKTSIEPSEEQLRRYRSKTTEDAVCRPL